MFAKEIGIKIAESTERTRLLFLRPQVSQARS